MSEKTLVTVTIGGEEYTLKSDRAAEYTRAAAEHVDRVVSDVRSMGKIVESHKAAVLAALSITDELFLMRQQHQELTERIKALTEELSRLLPPAKRSSRASDSIAQLGDEA